MKLPIDIVLKKPAKKTPRIQFNETAFKAAVKKVTVDEAFRKQLEDKPIATLKSLGFTFSEAVVKEFGDKKLSQAAHLGDFANAGRLLVYPNIHVYAMENVFARVGVQVCDIIDFNRFVHPGDPVSQEIVQKIQTEITTINSR